MTEKEINALIRLLDDPDAHVYSAVEKKILQEGEQMIPALEQAWYNSDNLPTLQRRVEKLLPRIQADIVQNLVSEWIASSGNLLKASWIISKVHYFDVCEQQYMDKYSELAAQIPQYAMNNFSPLEQIKIMNYTFFRKMGFKICKPEQFFLPEYGIPWHVLTNKVGNPETLAIFYMLFAKEAGLPIEAVNLPKNIILSYVNNDLLPKFYINPATTGSTFDRQEIDKFLKRFKIPILTEFYNPCPINTVLLRLLCRLEYNYRTGENSDKSDNILNISKIFPKQLKKGIEWL